MTADMNGGPLAWIDTHCHLTDEQFAGDVDEVITRAKAAGVTRLIVNAWDRPSINDVLLLARRVPEVYCTVGIHPSDAEQVTEESLAYLTGLLSRADELKIAAVGEIGLDYHYDGIDKEQQKKAFRAQLELAHRFGLPAVIHERDAHEDALILLQEAQADGILSREAPGVFHCYSGSAEFAQRLLPMGWYFGFDGPLTFKNGRKAKETLTELPRDRVVIETDSPYLAPSPHRGKRNEPALLPLIGEEAARLWNLTAEETSRILYENSLRLFPALNRQPNEPVNRP